MQHAYRRHKERGDLWKTLADIPSNSTFEGFTYPKVYKAGGDGSLVGMMEHQDAHGSYCRIFNGGESCISAGPQKSMRKEERTRRFEKSLRFLDQHCLIMILELSDLVPNLIYDSFGWKIKELPRAMSSKGELGSLYKLVNVKNIQPDKILRGDLLAGHYLDKILYAWAKRRTLERAHGCVPEARIHCPKPPGQQLPGQQTGGMQSQSEWVQQIAGLEAKLGAVFPPPSV
jgi:hypothetical protein